ncbi:sigma-70 family RNA polymerase sigma factor [soil metagenome]
MDRSEDRALVKRLLERDEDALREAMSTYGGLVFAMAKRVVADPTMAEEVAQDAFLAIWRRPSSYNSDRGSLQSFLLGVTRNKAIDLVRHEESLKKAKDALITEAEATSEGESAHELAVGMEERDELRAALQSISKVQREAVALAYFGGRTYREVAEELGIPEGTAKTRLRDGLAKLRQVLRVERNPHEQDVHEQDS